MLNSKSIISTVFIATMSSPVTAISTIAPHQEFSPKLDVDIHSSFSPYLGNNLTSVAKTVSKVEAQINVIDKIKALKVALGLPNTAVAEIVGISRQTLHSYFNTPDYDKNIHSKTLNRSIQLEEVTQLIKKHLNRSPAALSKNIFVDGHSLFDLLKSDELEFDKIEAVIERLAENMSTSSKGLPFNQQTLHDLTSST